VHHSKAAPVSQTVSVPETVEKHPQGADDRTPTSILISEARELAKMETALIDALHAAGPDEGTFVLEEVAERLTKLRNALTGVLDRLEEVWRAATEPRPQSE
jgi:hypothetical protein